VINRASFIKQDATGTAGDNIALGTATAPYREFADVFSDGDRVQYWLTYGTAWEVGIGELDDSAATLLRDADWVLESSSGSMIDVAEDDPCEISCGPSPLDMWRGFSFVRPYDSNQSISGSTETDLSFTVAAYDSEGLWTGSGQDEVTLPDWVSFITVEGRAKSAGTAATLKAYLNTTQLAMDDQGTAALEVVWATAVTPGSSNVVKLTGYHTSSSAQNWTETVLTVRFW
jgi:hypothetical protein